MSRPATGTTKWRKNSITGRHQWFCRLTMDDGGRSPWIELPESIAEEDVAGARRAACQYSEDARRTGLVKASVKETVSEYATRWLKSREGRVRSNDDNASHLNDHILPVIGTLDMRAVVGADIERLVDKLDAKVEAGALGAKTAANIWSTCGTMFDDATHAKPAEGLRCLTVDPTDKVRGPDEGNDKLLQFLYPSEFSQFMACRDVPRVWRRNAAIAVYLCLRDGEQRALRWEHVDLEHGMVHIAQAFNRRTGEVKEGTKHEKARQVPIPAALLPLLVAMRARAKGKGYVCGDEQHDTARGLRLWLHKAGVRRAELHRSTRVSKNLRWHDLRATGLTWMAVRGDPVHTIRDVAGHEATSQTDRYTRAAGLLRGGRFGEPFPPLPDAADLVFQGFDKVSSGDESRKAKRRTSLRYPVELTGIEQGREDRESSGIPATSSTPTIEVADESTPSPGLPAEVSKGLDRSLSDGDITSAIVEAVRLGLGDVAKTLSDELRERQRARAGNVVALDTAKRRGRP